MLVSDNYTTINPLLTSDVINIAYMNKGKMKFLLLKDIKRNLLHKYILIIKTVVCKY